MNINHAKLGLNVRVYSQISLGVCGIFCIIHVK